MTCYEVLTKLLFNACLYYNFFLFKIHTMNVIQLHITFDIFSEICYIR